MPTKDDNVDKRTPSTRGLPDVVAISHGGIAPAISKAIVLTWIKCVVEDPSDELVINVQELLSIRSFEVFCPPKERVQVKPIVGAIERHAKSLRELVGMLPDKADILDSVLVAYQLESFESLDKTATKRRDLHIWLDALADARRAFQTRGRADQYKEAIRGLKHLIETSGVRVTVHPTAKFVSFLLRANEDLPGLIFPIGSANTIGARRRYIERALSTN